MNKEEVLEKSRTENKGEDLQDKELFKEGGAVGVLATWIFATIFTVLRMLVDGEFPYDVWAMAGAVSATTYAVKAIRQKHWQDILCAVVWGIYAIVFLGAYICQLLAIL